MNHGINEEYSFVSIHPCIRFRWGWGMFVQYSMKRRRVLNWTQLEHKIQKLLKLISMERFIFHSYSSSHLFFALEIQVHWSCSLSLPLSHQAFFASLSQFIPVLLLLQLLKQLMHTKSTLVFCSSNCDDRNEIAEEERQWDWGGAYDRTPTSIQIFSLSIRPKISSSILFWKEEVKQLIRSFSFDFIIKIEN